MFYIFLSVVLTLLIAFTTFIIWASIELDDYIPEFDELDMY